VSYQVKYKLNITFRKITTLLRSWPSFLIIGAAKAGTTSLFHLLVQHPQINEALEKEIHFFDLNYYRGLNWYRYHFPIKKRICITGEASPLYLYWPETEKKVAKWFPYIKLIVILRNPIDRAYSQYQHAIRNGNEFLSFEEGITHEEKRLTSDFGKMEFSYLSRSLYYEQLSMWFKKFPRKQFCIIENEDFKNNTQEVVNTIFNFLNLPNHTLKSIPKLRSSGDPAIHNMYESKASSDIGIDGQPHIEDKVGDYTPMNPKTRKNLIDYFFLPNEALFSLLKMKYDWNR